MKKYLAYAGALTALAGMVNGAYAADATDDSLTWFGVTLYGTVDVGYTYQNRGVPLSDYFPVGLETMVQKNATKSISTVSENGMSQSKVGLRGIYNFYNDFSMVFRLETHFSPLSGNLSDGVKSVVQNNGVAAVNQNANGDSNRAGQPFGGMAYAGVSSPTYGTLTLGRQLSLLADNIGKYDPLSGSYAFSFLGYSGTFGGSGDTQDLRLDNSVKYVNQIGIARIGGMFANGYGTGSGGNYLGGDVGADPLPGLSFDAVYANKKDAILATPASAAQVVPCVAPNPEANPPHSTSCLVSGIDPHAAVNAAVSDNWTWGALASYVWQQFKFSGGFEDIHFRNPQVPLKVGAPDIGGYTLGWVNNNAYNYNAKILEYSFAGVKYTPIPKLDVYAAWYYILQNHFNPTAHCPGGIKDGAQCSGREAGYSLVADYKFNRHFDLYAGAMYSHLADGLASGGPNTMSIDPTLGGRFNF